MNCVNCGCEMKPALIFQACIAPDVNGCVFKQDRLRAQVCPQCGRVELKVEHPEKFR